MRNFFSTIKPFYFVSKTFGFFPMTLKGAPEKENFVVKWTDIIAPVLNGLLAVLLIVSISFYPLEDGVFTPMMTMTSTLISIFGTVLNFLQLIFQTSKHKSIANFYMKVNQFDKKVCFGIRTAILIAKIFSDGTSRTVSGSQKAKEIYYDHLNYLLCTIFLDDYAFILIFGRQRKTSIHPSSHDCMCFPITSEFFLRFAIFLCSFGT